MTTLPQDNSIVGVTCKPLKSWPDDRGFFREIIRSTEPVFSGGNFAQWSHSKMQKNVVKAWHYHHRQTDWWYVALGQIDAVLYDNREESPTYKKKLVIRLGDSSLGSDTAEACVRIPPGVLHGLQVLSEFAHLFYITSEIYNPDDEGRVPYNSDLVPHKWTSEAITVEKDRKVFVPKAERMKIG